MCQQEVIVCWISFLATVLYVAWTPNHFIPNRQINSVVYRPFTPELVNLYKKWLTDRDWRDILSLSDGDKTASLFCKELFEKYCEIFQQKEIYVKSNDKPWITQEIQNLIKVRNEFHLTGPVKDFKRVRNLIVYKIRCSRKQYLVQNIIDKKVTRVEVRDVNGKPLLPSEINDFFAPICKILPQLRKLPPNDSVSNIYVLGTCSVAKKLKALDSCKSSCSSEIPIKLIIECAIFYLLL